MSERAKKILRALGAVRGITEEELAGEIGYTRSHLNVLLNKTDSKSEQKILNKASAKWPEEIKQIVRLIDTRESPLSVEDPGETYGDPGMVQQNKLISAITKQTEVTTQILEKLSGSIEADLTYALGQIDSLQAYQLGQGHVILKSLARIEKRKNEGDLVKEADSKVIGILDELTKRGRRPVKGKQRNASS